MKIESGSIQLTIDGVPFSGLKSIQWDEPTFKDISRPIPLGVTEGTYKAEGSLTITKEGWERLLQMLPHWDWRYGGGNARDRRKRRRAARLGG